MFTSGETAHDPLGWPTSRVEDDRVVGATHTR
jgi:hypothetical protein